MIILITGTPGTGKTAVAKILSKKIDAKLIQIGAIEGIYIGVDEERGSKIVDMEKLSNKIGDMIVGDMVIEGHLSHLLPFGDIVIVLRSDPMELKKRLESKGFDEKKVQENLEAEALDVCLIESLERHENVYEIDTTKRKTDEVVDTIIDIVGGKTDEFEPGKIDWSEDFF